jgi:hypothetical protein
MTIFYFQIIYIALKPGVLSLKFASQIACHLERRLAELREANAVERSAVALSSCPAPYAMPNVDTAWYWIIDCPAQSDVAPGSTAP